MGAGVGCSPVISMFGAWVEMPGALASLLIPLGLISWAVFIVITAHAVIKRARLSARARREGVRYQEDHVRLFPPVLSLLEEGWKYSWEEFGGQERNALYGLHERRR